LTVPATSDSIVVWQSWAIWQVFKKLVFMASGLTSFRFQGQANLYKTFIYSLTQFAFRNAFSDTVFKLRGHVSGEFGGQKFAIWHGIRWQAAVLFDRDKKNKNINVSSDRKPTPVHTDMFLIKNAKFGAGWWNLQFHLLYYEDFLIRLIISFLLRTHYKC